MRTISGPLAALLALPYHFEQELYTFVLTGGSVRNFTSGRSPCTWNSVNYTVGPLFDKPRFKLRRGLSVDDFPVTLTVRNADTIANRPWATAVKDGLFAGARVTVLRAYSATPNGAIVGVITLADGYFGDYTPVGPKALLNIRDWTTLLDNPFPPNVYQTNCRNKLYDANCGVNPAGYTDTLTLTGTPTAGAFHVSGSARANGFYKNGVLIFTSGTCNRISRIVTDWTSPIITLSIPLPRAPAAGDTVTAKAGCDLYYTGDCSASKFNNQINFRGEPFVPAAETAI